MKADELLKKSDWTRRNLGEPVVFDDQYWLTVKTPHKGFADIFELQSFQLDAAKTALQHLLDYFALVKNEQFHAFAEQETQHGQWNLDARPNSHLLVLVKIPLQRFHSTFDLEKEQEKEFDELEEESAKTITLGPEKMDEAIANITARMQQMREGMRTWSGKILDFYPSAHERHLKELRTSVDELLEANGETFTNSITFFIDGGFAVSNIFYDDREMLKGLNVFYSQDATSSPRSLAFFVAYLENTDDWVSKDKDWIDLLREYAVPPVFIKPSLHKAKKGVTEAYDNVIDTLLPDLFEDEFKSTFAKQKEDDILTTDFKLRMRERRENETDFVGDQILFDYEIIPPKLSTIQDVFREILDKLDIGILIDIILRCIPNVGLPFPDFQIPEIPQIPNPTIEWPELPVIDLMAFIRLNLDELIRRLIKTILILLIQALLDLLSRICEDAMEIGSDGSGPGLVDIERAGGDVGIDPIDAADDFVNENEGDIPSDLLRDFLREVSISLSPAQLCALLGGNPSKMTMEIINDILDQERFTPLREFFDSDEKIIEFFAHLGRILGAARARDICEIGPVPTLDPCNVQDSAEALIRSLYEIKNARGETVPDDFIDEAIARSRSIKEEYTEMLIALASNPNVLDLLQDDLMSQIDDFKPADGMPEEVSMATDAVVDGMFDLVELQAQSAIVGMFNVAIDVQAEAAEDGRNIIHDYQRAFQMVELQHSISLEEEGVALANQTVLSPFFSDPDVIQSIRDFLARDANIPNILGLPELRQKVKTSQLNSTLSELTTSLEKGTSPFEVSMMLDGAKAFVRIMTLKWILEALSVFIYHDPAQLIGQERWFDVVANSIASQLSPSAREQIRNLQDDDLGEWIKNESKMAYDQWQTTFFAPLTLHLGSLPVEIDEDQKLGDVAIYGRDRFLEIFRYDDVKVSEVFNTATMNMRQQLDGIAKSIKG
jgi:hypothetical protein